MRPVRCLILCPPPGTARPLLPRGPLSIAGFLRHNGVDARLEPLEAGDRPWSGVVAALVAESRPDIIGVANPFTLTYPGTAEVARACRQAAPATPLVLGGTHVTPLARQCLEGLPEADAVVRGEGEWTFLEVVERLGRGRGLDGVAGVTFRRDGRVVENPARPLGDLAGLPPLDLGLLPDGHVRHMRAHALLARGCAYRCAFCAEAAFWGGRVRMADPQSLAGEQRELLRRGSTLLGIDDSMVDMRSAYFSRLCGVLGTLDLPQTFYVVTRVDSLTPGGLRLLRQSGVRHLTVGLESASGRVLERMNKGLRREAVVEGLCQARDAGFSVNSFWMFGHPGDGPDAAGETLEFMDRLLEEGLIDRTDVSWFTPLPGTAFFADPERHGIRVLSWDFGDWDHYGKGPDGPFPCELEGFPAGEVYAYYRRAQAILEKHLGVREGLELLEARRQDAATLVDLGRLVLRAAGDGELLEALGRRVLAEGTRHPLALARGALAVVAAPRGLAAGWLEGAPRGTQVEALPLGAAGPGRRTPEPAAQPEVALLRFESPAGGRRWLLGLLRKLDS